MFVLLTKINLFSIFFSFYAFLFYLFFGDIALPVCHDERGEWQGYNEAYEAEEGTPYGEGEKQDGWVKSHLLTHYLRCDNHINDDLYNAKDDERKTEHHPETLSCVESLESCEEGCWYEGEGVEIRHEVEDADEDAETDSHREPDDGEAYAEEYAHGEGYEALSADVCVEGVGCILCQFLPEMVSGFREYAYPVL